MGRDIICLDCAKAESEAGSEDEDEGATATASDGDEGATVKEKGVQMCSCQIDPRQSSYLEQQRLLREISSCVLPKFLGKIMFSLSFLVFLLFEF